MERREFLQLLGAAFGTALAACPMAVIAASQSSEVLTLSQTQWTTLEAICEQIIPPIRDVSTRQVGCVNFIDKLLAHEENSILPLYRDGLAALNSCTQHRWGTTFTELSVQNRVRALELMEDDDLGPWDTDKVSPAVLFTKLHFHTLLGFLAAPSFGGNKERQGWEAVGFPGHLHEMGGVSDEQVEGRQAAAHTLNDSGNPAPLAMQGDGCYEG